MFFPLTLEGRGATHLLRSYRRVAQCASKKIVIDEDLDAKFSGSIDPYLACLLWLLLCVDVRQVK